MQRCRHNGFPVLDDDGNLAGIVTLDDLRQTPLDHRLEKKVPEVMTAEVITVQPQHSLREALRRMHDNTVARLPVVSAEDLRRVVGILSRSDIINEYNRLALDEAPPEED